MWEVHLPFSNLKMSSTIRLFINDNRISTAVKTKSGSLLQVYPAKKQFADEVQWQAYWAETTKPKIILRFGDGTERSAPAPAPPKPVEPKAKLSDWTFTKSTKFNTTLPAGRYYIGDLCYVLGDNIYDNIFEEYSMWANIRTGAPARYTGLVEGWSKAKLKRVGIEYSEAPPEAQLYMLNNIKNEIAFLYNKLRDGKAHAIPDGRILILG